MLWRLLHDEDKNKSSFKFLVLLLGKKVVEVGE